jgi:nucleotide-binding universal stress UspA family protein
MIPVSGTVNGSIDDEGVHLATSDIRFKRILVGIDFSEQAALALKTAIAVGEIFGSEIFLVNAVSLFAYEAGQEPILPEMISAEIDSAKEEMRQIVVGDPRLNGLRLKTTVAYAGAVDLIEQVASEEKVDLIVLGSHGSSGLERLVLGSVAEAVLRKAACPVLVVGPNCRAELHPFRSILFATDLETTGLRAAQYASALSEHVHGHLTLLHVIENQTNVPSVESGLTENRLKQELQSLLPSDVGLFCESKVRLEYGSPAELIPVVAESEAASLIVVGLRNQSALADHSPWSTLSRVIRESRCGVLGVRGHLL